MKKLITVTEIMRSFSDIVGRVYYKKDSYYIKKGHNIVARLLPVQGSSMMKVKDLNNLFQSTSCLINEKDRDDFKVAMDESRALKTGGDKWD